MVKEKVLLTSNWDIWSNLNAPETYHMQHFPFPTCREKGTPTQLVPKVNDTKECMTLGQSNWTIYSS